MFETSILRNRRTKTPAGLAAAAIGELGAIAIAILIPLVYTEHLPAFVLTTSIAVPQRTPDPAPAELKAAQARRTPPIPTDKRRPFEAPVRIPNKVAMVIDQPEPPQAGPYVPGSTGPATASGPVLPLPVDTAVPPAPKPPDPKPPAAPKAIKHIVVGGNVQAAKIIRQVIPVYPALAKQARVQGTVELLGIIATDGTVQQLHVIKGHPLLVQAALDAVRQWIYKPTLLNGDPVEVEAPIEVHFTLAQ
jgi:protein TonB